MAKKKSVKLFNKGKRKLDVGGGEFLLPQTVGEVDSEIAEKLLKLYPNEVVEGGAPTSTGGDVKKLKAKIAELEADVAEKDAKIAELEAAYELLTSAGAVDPSAE